jgi:tRNA modification GTPase
MPGPNSYTGEDIVELSGHGNPVIIEQLLDSLVALGARLARPGEFTRRGLEHGRMDLLAAESLAGLIDARTVEGVRIAHEGMSGALSGQVSALREAALDLAAETEARLDHPGEDLGTMVDEALADRLRALAASAESQAGSWRSGRMALEGARVCLQGRVNVGKSSLFNRLLGTERALVSPEPGTTRDVVEKVGMLGGQEITWMDTAGLRPDPEPLEAAGMALADKLAQGVDLHLVLLPLHQPPSSSDADILARTEGETRLIVGTHADLPRHADAPVVDHAVDNLSAAGLPALTEAIADCLRGQTVSGAQAVLTSQRQHALLSSVSRHLADAATALLGPWGPAVAAEEIVHAVEDLGELHGTDAREAVLDRLFTRFCIGK